MSPSKTWTYSVFGVLLATWLSLICTVSGVPQRRTMPLPLPNFQTAPLIRNMPAIPMTVSRTGGNRLQNMVPVASKIQMPNYRAALIQPKAISCQTCAENGAQRVVCSIGIRGRYQEFGSPCKLERYNCNNPSTKFTFLSISTCAAYRTAKSQQLNGRIGAAKPAQQQMMSKPLPVTNSMSIQRIPISQIPASKLVKGGLNGNLRNPIPSPNAMGKQQIRSPWLSGGPQAPALNKGSIGKGAGMFNQGSGASRPFYGLPLRMNMPQNRNNRPFNARYPGYTFPYQMYPGQIYRTPSTSSTVTQNSNGVTTTTVAPSVTTTGTTTTTVAPSVTTAGATTTTVAPSVTTTGATTTTVTPLITTTSVVDTTLFVDTTIFVDTTPVVVNTTPFVDTTAFVDTTPVVVTTSFVDTTTLVDNTATVDTTPFVDYTT